MNNMCCEKHYAAESENLFLAQVCVELMFYFTTDNISVIYVTFSRVL